MNIGLIGLGRMGRGMAANILKAGHALVVNDISRAAAEPHLAAGATWAASPRELAAACEIVFTSLPTPADVEAVCEGPDGLAAGIRAGTAWFDMSTNAVDTVRRMHACLEPLGAFFLDAPVSGNPSGAASGKLAIWVGGDQAQFDRCKPVLDALGDQVLYVGNVGAGTVAKLVHNCSSAAISLVLAEVFSMGEKAGVDPVRLWEAVRQGAIGRQRTYDKFGNKMLTGDFDPPTFALKLVHKDIALSLKLAREVGVPMRMCGLVEQELTEALNRGWADKDANAFVLLQQERAGLPPYAADPARVKAVMAKG